MQAATSSTLDPMTQSCWRSQMPPWWRNCSAVRSLGLSCTTFTQAITTRRSGQSTWFGTTWHCLAASVTMACNNTVSLKQIQANLSDGLQGATAQDMLIASPIQGLKQRAGHMQSALCYAAPRSAC